MAAFTRKKIDSLTLGERLKKLREERRLNISEVSRGTKIQAKYLTFLEEGEYLRLPADVYVKGFLRSYAIFMGINESALIRQYLREKGIQKNIKKDFSDEKANKPIDFSSFVVTPKIIIIASISVFVIGVFTYLYLEVNNFVSQPRLFIVNPSDGMKIEGKIVHVTGVAEKDSRVAINDQGVLVNEKGEFSEDVGLKNGLNTITIKARNKFDKESVKTVSVNADYPNDENENAQAEMQNIEEKPFTAEIKLGADSAWLSIEVDDNLVYSGMTKQNSIQSFNAKNKIKITSGKGNGTFVKINDKDYGALSADPSPANDVVFTVDGKLTQDKNN